MSFDIKNKVVLITGANRGIGKAITDACFKHGAAKVYAAVRNLDSVGPLIETYGDKIVPISLDLTKPETIKAAASHARDVELVISNAGVLKTASALDAGAEEALRFEMEANVFGLLAMAQAFAPVLKSNGGGAFVQLNSVVSMKCFPQFSTYCASKAAAYSITQALRELLKEQGTHVVSVHPGPIATDMGDAAGFSDIASPVELVGEAIIASLNAGEFIHCYTDPMASQVGAAYESFAKNVIEADMSEG